MKTLELLIDSSCTTLGHLMDSLPSLNGLVLDGSKIHSFRDIGFGLQKLMMLSAANCNICDLDGFSIFSNLKEVRLSHNKISDLTPLALHDHLENVDLSHNVIEDTNSLAMLGTCINLRYLDIRQNPITSESFTSSLIDYHIPQVSHLLIASITTYIYFVYGNIAKVPQLNVLNGLQRSQMDPCRQLKNSPPSSHHNLRAQNGKHHHPKSTRTTPTSASVSYGSFEMRGNIARSILQRRSSQEFVEYLTKIKQTKHASNQTTTSPMSSNILTDTNVAKDINIRNTENAPIFEFYDNNPNHKTKSDGYSFVVDDDMACLELEIMKNHKSKETLNSSFTRQKCSRQYWKAKSTANNIVFDDDEDSDRVSFKSYDDQEGVVDEDYFVATRASMKHLFRKNAEST